MSTDSTELAFVRCPSCRSLVPAVSTRCRMCGETLDPSQQKPEEGSGESAKSGRVRQRTTATSSSDLSAAAGLIRQEMEGTPKEALKVSAESDEEGLPEQSSEGPAGAAKPEDTSALSDEDPLSAYIQEVDLDVEAPAPKGSSNGSAHAEAAVGAASTGAESSGSTASSSSEGSKQRVIVESGSRRNKPSGLSFGGSKRREDVPEASAREEEWKPVGDRPRPAKEQQPARADDRRGGGNDRREKTDDRRTAPRSQERGQERQQERNQERSQEPTSRQERAMERNQGERGSAERNERPRDGGRSESGRRSDSVEFTQPGTGKLVGWLVNYSDPKGVAAELREGRFFVSGTSLKPTDFVLSDPTVSTPHAMVAAGAHEGLRVQDLMSDRGVWVKRRSHESFQRVNDAVKVDHGDWLRFGEVEFLVCLVGAGAAK